MDRNDTVRRVQDTATRVADRVRDAHLDERAAELAAQAREKVRDAHIEQRAAELTALAREKVRDSGVADQAGDVAAQATEAARLATERALERVGDWLSDTEAADRISKTRVGDRLGVRPKSGRSRRWLYALVAMLAGVAAGVMVVRKRGAESDEFGAYEAPGEDRFESIAPAIAAPLEDQVRAALGSDSRTAVIPPLNVNVVEGTVFVRGSIPADVDQDALRTIIEGVEGVKDVDLQVTVRA